MKNIQIYYFSGTGNTAYVVRELANELRFLGNEVNISSCEEEPIITDNYDILGVAFPIHVSYAPLIFRKFLKKLPYTKEKPIFAVSTAGYMAGDVLAYEVHPLIDKGYKPFLYRNIVVGNNLHLPGLCPLKVTEKEKIKKRLPKIHREIRDIAMKVNNQTIDIRGSGIIGRIFGCAQRKVKNIHVGIGFKGFEADETCVKCGWCIKNCPTKNINAQDNKIVFKDKCIICMRCYNLCPKEAIQMIDKTKNKLKYKRYRMRLMDN